MSVRERNNMKYNARTGRSLLGIPDRNESQRMAQAQSEQLLEKDNDKKLEDLSKTVSKIKGLSIDIEHGIQDSNTLIDGLDTEMVGAQGLLKGAMKRLDTISKQGGTRTTCYLALFIVFVIVLLYCILIRCI